MCKQVCKHVSKTFVNFFIFKLELVSGGEDPLFNMDRPTGILGAKTER